MEAGNDVGRAEGNARGDVVLGSREQRYCRRVNRRGLDVLGNDPERFAGGIRWPNVAFHHDA